MSEPAVRWRKAPAWANGNRRAALAPGPLVAHKKHPHAPDRVSLTTPPDNRRLWCQPDPGGSHMSKEAEFEKIKAAAVALESRLHSDDQKVAEQAMAELKTVGLDLKAWAKKNGVTLTSHTETPPEARRRKCAVVIYPVVKGKVNECVLLGRDGRNCLYNCSPATLQPI